MVFISAGFVQKWRGRMLNIHPSLLPSFKGAHAHQLVLESRVLITGCTVHFVAVSCFYTVFLSSQPTIQLLS